MPRQFSPEREPTDETREEAEVSDLEESVAVEPTFLHSLGVLKAEESALQQEIWKIRGAADAIVRAEDVKKKLQIIEKKIVLVANKLETGQISKEDYVKFLETLLPSASFVDREIISIELFQLEVARKAALNNQVVSLKQFIPQFNIADFNQPIEPWMWRVRKEDGSVRYHDFVEKTYKSPAFCHYCATKNLKDFSNRNSFIAGLYKQGLQCSVCRFNVHKHCLEDCQQESLCGGATSKEAKLDPQELRFLFLDPLIRRFASLKETLLQLYNYALVSKDLEPLAGFLKCTDLQFVPLDLITNKRHLNGMLLAAEAGDTALAELLLAHSADVSASNTDGLSPLLQAAWSGHSDLVSLFLSREANTLQRTRKGSTALTLAIESGHQGIVRQLIQAGMPLNTLDEHTPFTPLMVAIMSAQAPVAQVLLELKADIELRTIGGAYDGFSALFFACLTGAEPIVQNLLKLKANPNSHTRDGFTPLIVASQKGRTNCVVTLSRVAQLEHSTSSGDTALMWAVYRRQWEVVGTLVSLGAVVSDNKRSCDATRVANLVHREREFTAAVATAHIYIAIPVLSLVLLVTGYRGIINDLADDRANRGQAFERSFVFRSE